MQGENHVRKKTSAEEILCGIFCPLPCRKKWRRGVTNSKNLSECKRHTALLVEYQEEMSSEALRAVEC